MEEIKVINSIKKELENPIRKEFAKVKEDIEDKIDLEIKLDDDFELEYDELKNKFLLPNFDRLCEDFDIGKVADKDFDYLLREIRRTINEKISAYLHLFETLINPSSPPIFVFSILRGIRDEDKEKMKVIYKILSRTQLMIMRLDTIYNQSSEAEFIIKTFNIWQKLKPQILELIKSFEENFEKDDSSKKSSYFD